MAKTPEYVSSDHYLVATCRKDLPICKMVCLSSQPMQVARLQVSSRPGIRLDIPDHDDSCVPFHINAIKN